MKNLKQILVLILILTTIFSCKKKENEQSTLSKETLSAKWIVDDASVFASFEFNKSGNYIVVVNSAAKSGKGQIVLFGTYEIIDSKTIILSDLGTISITEIGKNSIRFSIVLDSSPGDEIIITATKSDEIPNSARTALLCRTWDLISVNGVSVAGTDMELTVLFSAAGTYFVSFANPSDLGDGGLAWWTWKDNTQQSFCYSWDGEPTCDGTNEVEIAELTSSEAIIIEDTETYVLQPTSNAKSAVSMTSKALSTPKMVRGVFKK